MRAGRVAAAIAVCAGVAAAPMAHAATVRPACDLVTDPSGDVTPTTLGANNNDYDIRSADIATNKRQLTAVIRLTPSASFKQTYIDQLYVTSARAFGDDGAATPDGRVTVGSQSVATVVDDASSKARYAPGRTSCVRVGK